MDHRGGLTEEQRRRIEANRRRALDLARERRGDVVRRDASLHDQNPAPRAPLLHDGNAGHVESSATAAAATNNGMGLDSKPPRDSFGDGGIDWGAAAGAADRLPPAGAPDGAAGSPPQATSKRPKVEKENNDHTHRTHPNWHPSGLSEAQRARMEESRRRALEKKQRKGMHPPASTAPALSGPVVEGKPPTMTDEQRARIEENRRRALEKKQRNSATCSGNDDQPRMPRGDNGCAETENATSSGMTAEQRAKIEQNRLRALEKKRRRQNAAPPTDMPAPIQPAPLGDNQRANLHPSGMTAEQRATVEETRREALRKKRQQMTQQSTPAPPKASIQCPSPNNVCPQEPLRPRDEPSLPQPACDVPESKPTARSLSPDQRARMELNRQKALERKRQRGQLSQPSFGSEGPAADRPVPSAADPSQDVAHASAAPAAEGKPVDGDNASVASLPQELGGASFPDPAADARIHNGNGTSPSRAVAAAAAPASPGPHPNASPPQKKAASAKKSGLPPIPPELQYEEERVLPVDDDDIDALVENARLDEPLLNDWTLYEHQKEGVVRALRMRRLILAFDMGLVADNESKGKTIIGCVWAKAFRDTFEGLKTFVIAPVSLREDWERTATEATGLRVDAGDRKGKKAKPKKKPKKKKDVAKTVTGKRRKNAKKLDSDSEGEEKEDSDCDECGSSIDMHIYSWNKVDSYKEIVSGISDYIVICDEAHHMQSMASARTKDVLQLCYPKKCRGVLLLSGTPMKNGKPSNLFPLLKAVRHPFGDDQKRYEFYFCNGQTRLMRGKEIWDANGSSNLPQLNAHTSTHIFRLTKEECMSKELPPRKREFKQIPVPPRYELRYTQALKDLAEAVSLSSGPGESDDILTPFQKLRLISAQAKVDAIAALSNTILLEESSIVIFTFFQAVAKEIYRKLDDMGWGGELLTGETQAKKRQSMVDRFQSGLSPVFVCTYGAGGVGLTLTAACTVILVDRPWTPGDVSQAEDRVRRIGQKRKVRSIWIRAFPIDKQIDELIDHKEENSSTAVDGKGGNGGQSKAAPKISIAKLVKSVLSDDKKSS